MRLKAGQLPSKQLSLCTICLDSQERVVIHGVLCAVAVRLLEEGAVLKDKSEINFINIVLPGRSLDYAV